MNQWSNAAKMNYERICPASCALGKYLYVFFGLFGHLFGQTYGASIERLSIEDAAAEWESIETIF